jgi:primosomal protein N' (replication factor Y)
VCQACGAGAFANLRPGVARLREELEAAAARPVAALTGAGAAAEGPDPDTAGVVVGTEALLHRSAAADVVAFLEFDSEMLAPRFRASEQALALVVRAGRLAPEVLVQTFVPDHPVLRAARRGDPSIVVDAERERRRRLRLPPFGGLALVSGEGAADLAGRVAQNGSVEVDVGAMGDDRYLVRAADWAALGRAFEAVERPPGSRVRVEVDPVRV